MAHSEKERKTMTKILFICLGNICRSPAAEGIMQQMIDKQGLSERFLIDSAGIGNWHAGQLPDVRMRRQGAKRGYDFCHHARQFHAFEDFQRFDFIVVMDEENYRAITQMARSETEKLKVIRMSDYLTLHKATTVPDPYYGDTRDFDYALDLIEDGCAGLLAAFKPDIH